MLLFLEDLNVTAEQSLAKAEFTGGMPQLDFASYPSQIFWLAIAFGILYVALSRLLIPRIGGVLEERRDRIADDLDVAARMKIDADAALVAYEKSLKDAAARAHVIAAENRNKINMEIATEIETQDLKLAEIAASAEAEISQAQQKALSNVATLANTAVKEMITKLTGTKLSATDITKAMTSVAGKN